MTIRGAAVEEMVVLTARVILAVALSLAAWMRGQTLFLAAIILRVPESPGGVTVVVPADEMALAVRVLVAVPLP